MLILPQRTRHFFASILGSSGIEVSRQIPRAIPLGSVRAVAPFFNPLRGALQYYEQGTGKIFEVQPDGSGFHATSDVSLPGFTATVWSPDGRLVASSFSENGGTAWKVYEFGTGESVPLPRGTQAVTFSPDSSQLAYFRIEKDGAGVFIMPTAGGTPKRIFATRIPTAIIAWPDNDAIAVTLLRSSGQRTDVFLVTPSGEATHLINDQPSVETSWSGDASTVLISLENPSGDMELWIKDLRTGTFSILPFAAPASRCAWSHDAVRVFCATAHERESYNDITSIDLSTGAVTLVADGTDLIPRITAETLIISPDERYLVVVNRSNGIAYSITLP